MRVAVTGASGFLGRYVASSLIDQGHACQCWHRPSSDRAGLPEDPQRIRWVPGELGDGPAARALLDGCDAVVHSALHHPGGGFRGGEGDLLEFVEKNVVGTIQLIETARAIGVRRFVFISTCAVHERILDDRPLDEAHPLWPAGHYGAHKAAIEKFVHSFGHGQGYAVCALRPTGIYGVARPVEDSRWFGLIRAVAAGQDVHCQRGGKEVHAADVARAVGILLNAPAEKVAGEAFNCYDQYVSEFEVATIAKQLSGSRSALLGAPTQPRHQIETGKLRALGVRFGGRPLLESTIRELLAAVGGVKR